MMVIWLVAMNDRRQIREGRKVREGEEEGKKAVFLHLFLFLLLLR